MRFALSALTTSPMFHFHSPEQDRSWHHFDGVYPDAPEARIERHVVLLRILHDIEMTVLDLVATAKTEVPAFSDTGLAVHNVEEACRYLDRYGDFLKREIKRMRFDLLNH